MKMEIGGPTNVRHITHVTFDRFHGFLGLPVELEMEIPRRVPSASASVFGVSPESMQCSYDRRGNSVPAILLLMQERLYQQAGLEAEGIFRINAENNQEEQVRSQLNKGIVPYGIDVHCLAGLIKAWFRELPSGILDSLSPDQILHCHTEEQSMKLTNLLSPTQGALLDWAVNLMADVVQKEACNKMNAHNITMVFAPNMTQMSDPLTALMHVVQVMNFLKTLLLKVLHDREKAALDLEVPFSCAEPPYGSDSDNDTQGSSLVLSKCHGTKNWNVSKMMPLSHDLITSVMLAERESIQGFENACQKSSVNEIETKNKKISMHRRHSFSKIFKLLDILNAEHKITDLECMYHAQEAVNIGGKKRDVYSCSLILTSEWDSVCGAPCTSRDRKSKHLENGLNRNATIDKLQAHEKSHGKTYMQSDALSSSSHKRTTRLLLEKNSQECEGIEAL